MKPIKDVECPECGSKGFYTKLNGERRCKKCGKVFKEEE